MFLLPGRSQSLALSGGGPLVTPPALTAAGVPHKLGMFVDNARRRADQAHGGSADLVVHQSRCNVGLVCESGSYGRGKNRRKAEWGTRER